MLITTFVSTVYVPSRIRLSPAYVVNINSAANRLSSFLKKESRLLDLTTPNVSAYLTHYGQRWSARSTNNQRQILLSLWTDAADRPELVGLLSELPQPRKIKKLPEEFDPPTAWNVIQVADLFRHCLTLTGCVGDVPARDWWLSLYATIYWTSSRIGSMLAVTTDCYDGEGLLVRKQKNNRPQWHPLRESCRELIELTRPEKRKLIWAHPWHPRTVWAMCRRIIEAAGLPAPRTGRQLFHRLRRTAITLCASVDPVAAQRAAGHRDWSTTEKHYIDPRLLRRRSIADILPDPLELVLGPRNDPPLLYATDKPRFRIFG
jgi:hypothetical protein